MSAQRQRRWADVLQMLCKCFVFAGKVNVTIQLMRNEPWYFNGDILKSSLTTKSDKIVKTSGVKTGIAVGLGEKGIAVEDISNVV